MGGRAVLALDPGALRRLAGGRSSVLVSGTNGKTTTTSLLRAAAGTGGPVVTNLQGANLPFGIVTALAGGEGGATAVLEVDEAWLPRVVAETDPEVVVLLNLTRDQLDRNNEVRTLAGAWRLALEQRSGTTVVANADDPLVVWGAGGARRVLWVGAGQPWTADASGCPACGGRIGFPPVGSEGWACSSCGFRRPGLDVRVEGSEVLGPGGRRIPLRLALPGRANRANAAMALTAAGALGVDPVAAADAVAGITEVVGRYRLADVGGASARLLLAKNPAGWLEVLDVVRPPPSPVVVAINARIADGRDPSWLWDVPFERLSGRPVLATGERGRDVAVRLRYAEVEHRYIADPLGALREAARLAASAPAPARLAAAAPAPAASAAAPAPVDGPAVFDVVANYSAFQGLRGRLA